MTTENKYHNQILSKASEDDDFRTSLLEDPAAAVSTELGIEMPDGLTINVHEDSQNVVNLVLPPKTELSADELDRTIGGSGGLDGNPVDPW